MYLSQRLAINSVPKDIQLASINLIPVNKLSTFHLLVVIL